MQKSLFGNPLISMKRTCRLALVLLVQEGPWLSQVAQERDTFELTKPNAKKTCQHCTS